MIVWLLISKLRPHSTLQIPVKKSKDSYQKINYIGWQVKMVNKENYTFKEESLEKAKQKKEEFLKKVKESCK